MKEGKDLNREGPIHSPKIWWTLAHKGLKLTACVASGEHCGDQTATAGVAILPSLFFSKLHVFIFFLFGKFPFYFGTGGNSVILIVPSLPLPPAADRPTSRARFKKTRTSLVGDRSFTVAGLWLWNSLSIYVTLNILSWSSAGYWRRTCFAKDSDA